MRRGAAFWWRFLVNIPTAHGPPGLTSLSPPQAQGEGASAEVLTTFAPAPSPLGGNNCGRRFTVLGTGIPISFATGRPPFKNPRRTFIGPQDALNKCAAPLPTAAERRAKSGSRDPIDFARRSAAVGGFKGPRRGGVAALPHRCPPVNVGSGAAFRRNRWPKFLFYCILVFTRNSLF